MDISSVASHAGCFVLGEIVMLILVTGYACLKAGSDEDDMMEGLGFTCEDDL